jgi:UDP-glucuronate 4-epimerase
MTILVTGGAGFIGSHLCERLLKEGPFVACVDNFNDFYDPARKRRNLAAAQEHPGFTLHEVDICDGEALRAAFAAARPDVVVHLAAWAGVRPSRRWPQRYVAVNVGGTTNVLECCREVGVTRLVFGSSSSVYGNAAALPFQEEDPAVQPISPYAATKRAGELLGHTYHHLYGLNVTCLRFFTVYGPRQRPDLAIHKFTRLIDTGQPVEMYGDGTSQRDYTYVDDLIDGVVRAIDRDLGYEIINLGEARTVALRELIALLENALGKKAIIKRLPPQPGDVERTYADVTKAGRLLGYQPQTPIEEGLERFVAWYREEQKYG